MFRSESFPSIVAQHGHFGAVGAVYTRIYGGPYKYGQIRSSEGDESSCMADDVILHQITLG